MEASLKRKLAIGTAALTLLAGAGGAYAATRDSGGEGDAFLNDVAKRLGVPREKLDSAMEGAFSDRLDAAVEAGRLTREQADEIEQHAKERGSVPPFFGPRQRGFGPPLLGFGPPRVIGPLFGGLDAAADYLGLSDDQLRERLMDGDSLAAVARDRGKSVDGLKDAIEASIRENLNKAVEDKRLTDEQRERSLNHVDELVDRLVERRPPEPPADLPADLPAPPDRPGFGWQRHP